MIDEGLCVSVDFLLPASAQRQTGTMAAKALSYVSFFKAKSLTTKPVR
jgi:hypothetical protein